MNKKIILITAAVTSVAVFVLTTIFYFLPIGVYVYSGISKVMGKSDFLKLSKMEDIIKSDYMGEYHQSLFVDSAARGLASSLGDKYTEYLNRDEFKSMNDNLNGGYKGIGVKITGTQGKVYVFYVQEDGPAYNAGIQVGDFILAVDGKEYPGAKLADAISDIRDTPKDGTVVLTIERNGEVMDIPVVCTTVEVKYISGRMLEDNIGYIRVGTFGNNIEKDFEEKIEELKSDGMKSLVIDLRSNPGGSLESVTKMCDILLPEGIITTVKNKDEVADEYKSDENEIGIPMCVLVNSESASASEVMAAALKDYKKAWLIGEKTFGKGVVQGIYDLGDGSGFKVTVAKYYTPNGVCIDGEGIEPDEVVSLPENAIPKSFDEPFEGDIQLDAAVRYLRGIL